MNQNPSSARHMPRLPVDPADVAIQIASLAGSDCERCGNLLARAVTDLALLLNHAGVLHDMLAAERMRSANLEAAIRAALSAADDGETDPIAYLRYELPHLARGDAHGA